MSDVIVENPFSLTVRAAEVSRQSIGDQLEKVSANFAHAEAAEKDARYLSEIAQRIIDLAQKKFKDAPLIALDWEVAEIALTWRVERDVAELPSVAPAVLPVAAGGIMGALAHEVVLAHRAEIQRRNLSENPENVFDLYREVIEGMKAGKTCDDPTVMSSLRTIMQKTDEGRPIEQSAFVPRLAMADDQRHETERFLRFGVMQEFNDVREEYVSAARQEAAAGGENSQALFDAKEALIESAFEQGLSAIRPLAVRRLDRINHYMRQLKPDAA